MGLHWGISDLLLSLCCDDAVMHLAPPRLFVQRKGAQMLEENLCPAASI